MVEAHMLHMEPRTVLLHVRLCGGFRRNSRGPFASNEAYQLKGIDHALIHQGPTL